MRPRMGTWCFALALLFWSVVSAAANLPAEVRINGVEFIRVPAGEFWYTVQRGRPYDLKPKEPHFRDVRIYLDEYYVAKYEARASDLVRFLNSGDAKFGEEFGARKDKGCSVEIREGGVFAPISPDRDLPATQMSWNLADEFARWMGFRLLSEAEWEKAARGSGDKRYWPWGNAYPDDTFAAFFNNPVCNANPVSSFPKGRSPYGAYNMAGNAYEWVANWYNAEWDAALRDGAKNPALPAEGTLHVDMFEPVKILKGGRWGDDPSVITVYFRNLDRPSVPFLCFGTRFAVDSEVVRRHLESGTAEVLVQ